MLAKTAQDPIMDWYPIWAQSILEIRECLSIPILKGALALLHVATLHLYQGGSITHDQARLLTMVALSTAQHAARDAMALVNTTGVLH